MSVSGSQRDSLEPVDDQPPRVFTSEHWVDFFGGLVPGVFFVASSIFCIYPAIHFLLNALTTDYKTTIGTQIFDLIKVLSELPSMGWIVMGIVLFPVSYFIGHLFYRQDPKIPNQKGFAKLKKAIEAKPKHDEDLTETLKKELCCTSEAECEFPYPYLDKYLENRGLHHLTRFVVWNENRFYRSKNHINILKTRLKFFFPNKCGTIVRNEAHIRLASSMWYVARALITCSKLSGIIIGLTIGLAVVLSSSTETFSPKIIVENRNILRDILIASICAVFTFAAAKYVIKKIESFIHYQRQREIVHVLETAWIAFKDNPEVLDPPFGEPD